MKKKQNLLNKNLLINVLSSGFKVFGFVAKVVTRSLSNFIWLQVLVVLICAMTETEYFLSDGVNWFLGIGLLIFNYLSYKYILNEKVISW